MSYEIINAKIQSGTYQSRNGEDNFRTDVLKAYGVAEHPKAELAFRIAWEAGHANGLTEVLYWFDEIVELIR